MSGGHHRATVFVDADNTLWDTDALFAGAQLALLAAVESAIVVRAPESDRLAFLREIDQAIAERHHAGLRYPPRLLVRATELALDGLTADEAARAAWRGGMNYRLHDHDAGAIEQLFFDHLARAPQVRPGVADGLFQLREADCPLLIVTEGPKAKVKRNSDRLDLTRFFDRVIEGRKAPELYRRVLALVGTPDRAFMVGDQLDRDIIPAKAAGLETIYFPGGFRPRWTPDEASVRPDHVVSSFADVPPIVLGLVGLPVGSRAASA